MSNSVKDRIARLQAIAAQKQTGVAIMLLLRASALTPERSFDY